LKHLLYPHRFTVRCTRAERRLLAERVRASGLSVSRFLIQTGINSANPASVDDRARLERLLFQLHKIGVNLNQLTRRINTGIPVGAEPLDRALRAVADIGRSLSGSDS